MSLADDMDLVEGTWQRLFGATQWPKMPWVFSGTTELTSATREEIEAYYVAEAQAAKRPRSGKKIVLARPVFRVCFVRPGLGGDLTPGTRIAPAPTSDPRYNTTASRLPVTVPAASIAQESMSHNDNMGEGNRTPLFGTQVLAEDNEQ